MIPSAACTMDRGPPAAPEKRAGCGTRAGGSGFRHSEGVDGAVGSTRSAVAICSLTTAIAPCKSKTAAERPAPPDGAAHPASCRVKPPARAGIWSNERPVVRRGATVCLIQLRRAMAAKAGRSSHTQQRRQPGPHHRSKTRPQRCARPSLILQSVTRRQQRSAGGCGGVGSGAALGRGLGDPPEPSAPPRRSKPSTRTRVALARRWWKLARFSACRDCSSRRASSAALRRGLLGLLGLVDAALRSAAPSSEGAVEKAFRHGRRGCVWEERLCCSHERPATCDVCCPAGQISQLKQLCEGRLLPVF